MNYGSIGKRLVAWIIDSVLITVVGSFWFFLTDEWYIGLFYAVTGALYYCLFEGGPWQATPGKKVMGLIVTDENGMKIDYGLALLRYMGRYLSSLIFGIGYFIALFDDRCRTLHDRLARTLVLDGTVSPVANGSSSPSGHSVVGITGELAGMRFPITGNGVMIGRDDVSCQIVLRRSKGVSRLHCFVSFNPASQMFILSDRNSKYGTFTGSGVRVTPQKSVALKSGERFYLGSKDNTFEVV